MKVGFLLLEKHAGIGGTERVLLDITNGISNKITPYVYFVHQPTHTEFIQCFQNKCFFSVPKILREKHPLRPRILFRYFLNKATKRLFNSIKNDQLDALLILNLDNSFLTYHHLIEQFKKETSIPIIAWPHTSMMKMLNRNNQFRKKLEIFDTFFAISDGLSDEFTKLNLKNIVTVYNPIEPATVIKRNHKKFLYIGRIDGNKRVHELINILSQLQSSDWSFDIIGSTGNEKSDLDFIQYIKNNDPYQNITFHGWQQDPWSIVQEAGVLLLNSKSEGFALVLAEAMMRGIPCLSSNCPVGPANIIQNNINGWLFEPDDEKKCIEILDKILDGSILLPPTESIQESVKKFDKNIVINNFTKHLAEVITSHHLI